MFSSLLEGISSLFLFEKVLVLNDGSVAFLEGEVCEFFVALLSSASLERDDSLLFDLGLLASVGSRNLLDIWEGVLLGAL